MLTMLLSIYIYEYNDRYLQFNKIVFNLLLDVVIKLYLGINFFKHKYENCNLFFSIKKKNC